MNRAAIKADFQYCSTKVGSKVNAAHQLTAPCSVFQWSRDLFAKTKDDCARRWTARIVHDAAFPDAEIGSRFDVNTDQQQNLRRDELFQERDKRAELKRRIKDKSRAVLRYLDKEVKARFSRPETN